MIQFVSLELWNFAIYEHASFDFATAKSKPLTVIRGENQSGKTTLMRAFLWVLFGADGLQEPLENVAVLRPVWAGSGEQVLTKVKLQFRQVTERGSRSFNLVRSLSTKDKQGGRLDWDKVSLAAQQSDGSYTTLTESHIETLLRIIRPEMRDFYFIDADKAVDFVGGSEGNHSDLLMRKMIGRSIRALLALDELRRAAERVDDKRNEYMRALGKLSKGASGVNLQSDLERVESRIGSIKGELPIAISALETAAEEYRKADDKFSRFVEALEQASKLSQELNRERKAREKLLAARRDALHQLAEQMPGLDIAAALTLGSSRAVIARLEPMKAEGHIPPTELDVIPRLLERRVCLCGTPLVPDSEHTKCLQQLLRSTQKTEVGARFLDAVLGIARRYDRIGARPRGGDVVESARNLLADLDPKVAAHTVVIEDLDSRIAADSGDEGRSREFKKHLEDQQVRRDSAQVAVDRLQLELKELESQRRSFQEQIKAAAGKGEEAKRLQALASAAGLVNAILRRAYERLEIEQVKDVSKSMELIFSSIIGNAENALISSVGLRRCDTKGSSSEYELYAKSGDEELPLKLVNGASRRALSVAFVLALAEETNTRVPLVCDSLLHSTSGEVRRRLMEFLSSGERVGQPIVFGTRADFQDSGVRAAIERFAGATFTLTAQSQVGVDVVNADPNRVQSKQVSVCKCAPGEFCEVCERIGDRVA